MSTTDTESPPAEFNYPTPADYPTLTDIAYIAAIDDPDTRAADLRPMLLQVTAALLHERSRRDNAALTLLREWDDAYAKYRADVEAIKPVADVEAEHAEALTRLRQRWERGQCSHASYLRAVDAENAHHEARLAVPTRKDGLDYAQALADLDTEYRERKRTIAYTPAHVARLINKSRGLVTRMRERAPADLPHVEDPEAQAAEAARRVDILAPLQRALIEVRDATVFDLADAHPGLSNVAIADLVGLDTGQGVTRIRRGA